jgi:hypothetical protein
MGVVRICAAPASISYPFFVPAAYAAGFHHHRLFFNGVG